MKNKIILFAVILLIFTSCCSDEKSKVIVSCGQNGVVLPETQYDAAESSYYVITNVALSGNCLSVTVGASGCNPDNFVFNLFSTNTFYEIFPLQRRAKIQLVSNQACAAYFEKTVVFDLTPFQLSGQNNLTINLKNWDEPINYQY